MLKRYSLTGGFVALCLFLIVGATLARKAAKTVTDVLVTNTSATPVPVSAVGNTKVSILGIPTVIAAEPASGYKVTVSNADINPVPTRLQGTPGVLMATPQSSRDPERNTIQIFQQIYSDPGGGSIQLKPVYTVPAGKMLVIDNIYASTYSYDTSIYGTMIELLTWAPNQGGSVTNGDMYLQLQAPAGVTPVSGASFYFCNAQVHLLVAGGVSFAEYGAYDGTSNTYSTSLTITGHLMDQ